MSRFSRRRRLILMITASLILLFVIALSLWIFVPAVRSAASDRLRKINYDAYLKYEARSMLSPSSGYSGLQRAGGTGDCIRLLIARIDPRPNNPRYRNWDYICVVSVDGRYKFAFRPWDTQLLLPFYEYEMNDAIAEYNWVDGFVEAEIERIYPCISRSWLQEAKELEITIVSARTPLSGGLRPIRIGAGWSNVAGYETVVKRVIPVSEVP